MDEFKQIYQARWHGRMLEEGMTHAFLIKEIRAKAGVGKMVAHRQIKTALSKGIIEDVGGLYYFASSYKVDIGRSPQAEKIYFDLTNKKIWK